MALTSAVVAGLLFGSFLNVCILRLPAYESVVRPGSHCLLCGSSIRPWDNVPVLSWLWLRGRCRHCGGAISVQYPLVELATALLFAGCLLQTGLGWQTLIDAVTCFFLLGLAMMDAQTMLLPDAFTLTGLGTAFLLKVCAPGIAENSARVRIAAETALAAAVPAAIFLLIWAVYWAVRRRHGLGFGDVKLLAMMGALLGLPRTLLAIFLAVIVAAVFAVMIVPRGTDRGSERVPLGTFLAAAGILVLFAGTPLLTWYLSFFR